MTKALFTKLHDYIELRKNAAVPPSIASLEQGVSSSGIVEVSQLLYPYIESSTEERLQHL